MVSCNQTLRQHFSCPQRHPATVGGVHGVGAGVCSVTDCVCNNYVVGGRVCACVLGVSA